jgi:low affinity Fe/Cu permease
MVFLIQNSQNREGEALQAKLDELIRALDAAEDRFIGLEHRSEKEIGEMRPTIDLDDAPQSAASQASA